MSDPCLTCSSSNSSEPSFSLSWPISDVLWSVVAGLRFGWRASCLTWWSLCQTRWRFGARCSSIGSSGWLTVGLPRQTYAVATDGSRIVTSRACLSEQQLWAYGRAPQVYSFFPYRPSAFSNSSHLATLHHTASPAVPFELFRLVGLNCRPRPDVW